MALFTDGSISGLDDFVAHDSQLLDIATVEGIDVTRKTTLAQEEIGLELVNMLNRLHFVDRPSWVASQPDLKDIVVTRSLKLWHIYRTLEMVYSDAFSSQLNDRYAAKRDQFHDAAQRARDQLMQIGVGVTAQPVPRAQPPQVIAIPGNLADGTYYITMAWLNSLGESGKSALPTAITLSASTFQVQPLPSPPAATSWNVFAGHTPDGMFLQNGAEIPIGEIWIQPAPLIENGQGPSEGQEPNYLKPLPRVLPRG
jgi:hypothetical protein